MGGCGGVCADNADAGIGEMVQKLEKHTDIILEASHINQPWGEKKNQKVEF